MILAHLAQALLLALLEPIMTIDCRLPRLDILGGILLADSRPWPIHRELLVVL